MYILCFTPPFSPYFMWLLVPTYGKKLKRWDYTVYVKTLILHSLRFWTYPPNFMVWYLNDVAFFGEWLFSHHMGLLDYQLNSCLCGHSTTLLKLVSEPRLHYQITSTLGVLVTPYYPKIKGLNDLLSSCWSGLSLQVIVKNGTRTRDKLFEHQLLCHLSYFHCSTLRCARPAAPYPFEIQNTTHLISFSLQDTQCYFTLRDRPLLRL